MKGPAHRIAPKSPASSPAWKLQVDNPHIVSAVERARRAELADTAGTVGIIAAILGLLWMLGKCGPTLLPVIFR